MELYPVFSFVSGFLWSTYIYQIHSLVVQLCSLIYFAAEYSVYCMDAPQSTFILLSMGSGSCFLLGAVTSNAAVNILVLSNVRELLENSSSQSEVRGSWGFPRFSEGDCNIKTIFITMLRYHLPITVMLSGVRSRSNMMCKDVLFCWHPEYCWAFWLSFNFWPGMCW